VHCGVGGGGDFRGLSDQALAWVWEGAQRAGLALDTSVGSKLFELLPDPMSPISPFDDTNLTLWQRAKLNIMNALWRRGDRQPPAQYGQVSKSARHRWKADPSALPEKVAYRPETLKTYSEELDASPPLPPPPRPGTFNIVRVGPDETLRKIALERLGDAKRAQEIFNLNQDVLDDPNHIYCGMPLRVPKQ
jgi:nucleoid-associated protein YgaU